MLRVPNLAAEAPATESPFDFPLDPFQKHAIHAISNDENVLVTAKTGSGKTLVGEFQIWHSLKKGRRVFYTTPIKSLSNQKFHDLKKIYGDRVGIMTGDIKFCPQADIVIMTTEILRNLLFKQGTPTESVGVSASLSLEGLDAVVFDEVHYFNDPDRGMVWEECLTMLPPAVNLVLLSATIDQPAEFARWLGEIKQKPVHLISTEYRIVPLVHMTEAGDVVMDAKDVFYEDTYAKWVRGQEGVRDEMRRHRERVKAREAGQDVVERGAHAHSFVERMNRMISRIDLPALFFVFSRDKCRAYAEAVSASLLTSSEAADVAHIMKFHLRNVPNLETMAQYVSLAKLLEKGVAYHHSGLLPVLKEIVEILFEKGFVKVLFATETFAVGINMPTKTVVFTSFRKFDGDASMRMLTTSEYIQMAGRAGRRGKDDKGQVYYLPTHDPEPPAAVRQMMTGRRAQLTSRMDFGYAYILSSMNSGKNIQKDTFWAVQRRQEIAHLEAFVIDKECALPDLPQEMLRECVIREHVETAIHFSVNAAKKAAQTELNKWTNTHMGPKWAAAWKTYRARSHIIREISSAQQELEFLRDTTIETDARTDVLEKIGFVDDGALTPKGMLASEVNEGHPLLTTFLFCDSGLRAESAETIAQALSMFLEKPRSDDFVEVRAGYVLKADEYARNIAALETLNSDPGYWDTTSFWADVVREWMAGNDFVCEQFGVEQGNFVKAMLKLAGMLDEWTSLATLAQDVETVEKMKDVKQRVVRSFVIPDSLYLRI